MEFTNDVKEYVLHALKSAKESDCHLCPFNFWYSPYGKYLESITKKVYIGMFEVGFFIYNDDLYRIGDEKIYCYGKVEPVLILK